MWKELTYLNSLVKLEVWLSECKALSFGYRIIYFEKCDGKICTCYTSLGEKHKIPVNHITKIYSIIGYDHKIDQDSGYLMIKDKNDKNAVFKNLCPWLIYVKEVVVKPKKIRRVSTRKKKSMEDMLGVL